MTWESTAVEKHEGKPMQAIIKRMVLTASLLAGFAGAARAQQALTWDEVRARFEANNPVLRAGQIGIDESKANEITAYLRPNPQFTLLTDGTQIVRSHGVWQPFSGTLVTPSLSYLHERAHKRELRLESAQKATDMAVSGEADLERGLLFTLRGAFVSTLQAEAVLHLVEANL